MRMSHLLDLRCLSNDKNVDIKDIVGPHNPLLCTGSLVTKTLFNDEVTLQHVHLQLITERYSHFSSSLVLFNHMLVKKCCSEFSIFAGRNLLVSIN